MVAIKGMDMPKECWKCELITENTGGENLCAITGETLKRRGISDKRPDSCPLVEVNCGGN